MRERKEEKNIILYFQVIHVVKNKIRDLKIVTVLESCLPGNLRELCLSNLKSFATFSQNRYLESMSFSTSPEPLFALYA